MCTPVDGICDPRNWWYNVSVQVRRRPLLGLWRAPSRRCPRSWRVYGDPAPRPLGLARCSTASSPTACSSPCRGGSPTRTTSAARHARRRRGPFAIAHASPTPDAPRPNHKPTPRAPRPSPSPSPEQAGCDFYGKPTHAIWFHIPTAHRKAVVALLLGNTFGQFANQAPYAPYALLSLSLAPRPLSFSADVPSYQSLCVSACMRAYTSIQPGAIPPYALFSLSLAPRPLSFSADVPSYQSLFVPACLRAYTSIQPFAVSTHPPSCLPARPRGSCTSTSTRRRVATRRHLARPLALPSALGPRPGPCPTSLWALSAQRRPYAWHVHGVCMVHA